ncbi:MAG TPA: AzlC family ABC transporter permease [Limnochordales bacterium]
MKTESMSHRPWLAGVKAALPIAVGYVPAAVAFGVAGRQAGLGVAETLLMSLVIYAGASQFALAGMIGAGVPAPAAAAAALALNVRHVLYGPALAPLLPKLGRGGTAVVAFGLTDEVFAVASALLPGRSVSGWWLLGLEAMAYGAWVAGTWIGAVGGEAVAVRLPGVAAAMSFALPALFVALLMTLLASGPQKASEGETRALRTSAAVGAVVALGAWYVGWDRWAVLMAGLAGPVAGWAWLRRESAHGATRRPERG